MELRATPRIDARRLWQSLMDLAQIGATPKGGVCRIALTNDDRRGRDHNEIEDALPEHIAAGANVLLLAMLERAHCV